MTRVTVPPQKKQPPAQQSLPVVYALGALQSSSPGPSAWREAPPLSRKEDDLNLIRLTTSQGHPAKAQEILLIWCLARRLKDARDAFSDIMGIYWRTVEVSRMIYALTERGIRVDNVQRYWIVQEDPHYTFLPAGSDEEVWLVPVPIFPW